MEKRDPPSSPIWQNRMDLEKTEIKIREQTIHELDFKPLPFLKSQHSQTILASFGLPVWGPPSEKQMFQLEGKNKLCCLQHIPKNWDAQKGIVILLHGMGGSSQSHYIRRISSKLYRLGYFVFCLNRRGCGCGEGLASPLCHGGWTEDLLLVLKSLRENYPDSPIRVVGFSLGGNLLLKLLGELGAEGNKYLSHGIAVSPVVDLRDASETLGLPSNRIYERYYVNGLMTLVRAAEKAFPDEKKTAFPERCSIIQYDALYTAPKWGYKSVYDYYAKNSSAAFVPKIQVPCDLLYAADDPFIRFEIIQSLPFPPCVKLWKTKYGGHMGFLGFVDRYTSIRWMDHTVVSWIEQGP